MFGSSLPLVVCRIVHVLFMLFVVVFGKVMFNIYSVVFLLWLS